MRPFIAIVLVVCAAVALPRAHGQEVSLAIKADDGLPVANHRISPELAHAIEQLAGIVTVGNGDADVTLVEFYDLNCPYCRKAAPEIAELLRADKKLKLILVPFPVLSIASIQASRVELALLPLATPRQFYDFHRKIYAGRGVVDGARALAAAKGLGFDTMKLTEAANEDDVSEMMKSHIRLGDALKLAATPSFVIKDVAIVGYPGRKSLDGIVKSVRRCDNLVC